MLGILVDFGRDSDEEDQMVWYFTHLTLQEVNDLGVQLAALAENLPEHRDGSYNKKFTGASKAEQE